MELSQSFCFNHKRFLFLILQYPTNDKYKNSKISLSLLDEREGFDSKEVFERDGFEIEGLEGRGIGDGKIGEGRDYSLF
jgi:hypothetical protein